jgi:hypothetical protein
MFFEYEDEDDDEDDSSDRAAAPPEPFFSGIIMDEIRPVRRDEVAKREQD